MKGIFQKVFLKPTHACSIEEAEAEEEKVVSKAVELLCSGSVPHLIDSVDNNFGEVPILKKCDQRVCSNYREITQLGRFASGCWRGECAH